MIDDNAIRAIESILRRGDKALITPLKHGVHVSSIRKELIYNSNIQKEFGTKS